MTGLPKPKRQIRVERNTHHAEVHDDGHSWAVSYADFLMVLLSFFVLFFSVEGKSKKSLIDQLANKASLVDTSGKDGPQKDRSVASDGYLPAGIDKLSEKLDGFYVEGVDKKQKLFIYFKDNIYDPGQVDLPKSEVERLIGILNNLKPYNNQLKITFIGHTDQSAVTKSRARYLSDNFELSSLRATRALQQAVRAGFDPHQMYVQGVAEHSRGNRTLSLVITPREVEK